MGLTPALVLAQTKEDEIRAYLEAHPEFLAEHPELVESALAEQHSREAQANAARRLELIRQLKSSSGIVAADADSTSGYQLVFFGFTHCPDICPLALSNMAQALALLGARGNDIQPLFISVDPDRDSAQALADYAGYFDARFEAVTGSSDLLAETQDAFSVRSEKVMQPGSDDGNYTVNHSSWIFLLDRDGQILNRYPADSETSVMAQSILRFMGVEQG